MHYSHIVDVSGQDIFDQSGQTRKFLAGQMIAERGAPANRLYYIREGQVRAFLSSPDGKDITLFYIDAGNMCCTESLITHPEYIVNIEAVSDVTVCSMDPEAFLREWEARGYSIKQLLSHFVRRILLLSDYLCCMRFNKSISRVAYFLHSTYTDGYSPVYFTHEEIAGLVGMSTITVERCLKKLEDYGVIRCEYRKITVIQEEKLTEYFSSLAYGLD